MALLPTEVVNHNLGRLAHVIPLQMFICCLAFAFHLNIIKQVCSYRYSCKLAEDDSFDMFSDLENVKINNQSRSRQGQDFLALGLLVWTGQLDQLHTFTVRKN